MSIDAQIFVLEKRMMPGSPSMDVYADDYEQHASALDAARWAYDTKDVYPPPSAAWREAIEGEA